MTDISDTLAPKSDQLDAVDLVQGPRTFTVESVVVKPGTDQPVSVTLRGFPRVWRPGKNMRRVLGELWGNESAAWTDRSVTLYNDPTVRFGGETVGGIRISHMSHLDGPKKATIIPTRGKSAQWPVKPLETQPAAPVAPSLVEVENATREQVTQWWGEHPNLRPQLTARAEVLKAAEVQS